MYLTKGIIVYGIVFKDYLSLYIISICANCFVIMFLLLIAVYSLKKKQKTKTQCFIPPEAFCEVVLLGLFVYDRHFVKNSGNNPGHVAV